MELLVVTWAVRFALIGGVVAAVLSLMAGAQIVDAAVRSLIAALAFLLAARFLLDAMEPPEQKMARLRARRAKQAKKNGGKTPSKGDPAATRAVARSRTA
jgi:hypothetical protein